MLQSLVINGRVCPSTSDPRKGFFGITNSLPGLTVRWRTRRVNTGPEASEKVSFHKCVQGLNTCEETELLKGTRCRLKQVNRPQFFPRPTGSRRSDHGDDARLDFLTDGKHELRSIGGSAFASPSALPLLCICNVRMAPLSSKLRMNIDIVLHCGKLHIRRVKRMNVPRGNFSFAGQAIVTAKSSHPFAFTLRL